MNSSGFNLNNSHENGRVFLILDSKQLFRAVHFNLQNEGIYRKLIVISSWKYHFSLGFYKKIKLFKEMFRNPGWTSQMQDELKPCFARGSLKQSPKVWFIWFDLIWYYFDFDLIFKKTVNTFSPQTHKSCIENPQF